MPRRPIDVTDKRFERLVAKKIVGSTKKQGSIWECKCACGNVITATIQALMNGNKKSCGCLNKDSARGRRKTKNKKTSKYKGVSWSKSAYKWRGDIMLNGESFYLGLFDNEVVAAKEYNIKAVELFGKNALLNQLPV